MTKADTVPEGAQGEGWLGKAADDEPVFVLRGNDALAAMTVHYWADLAAAHKSTPEKVVGARAVADQMQSWAETRGSKVPD